MTVAALVSVVIIVALGALGTGLNAVFNSAANSLTGAV